MVLTADAKDRTRRGVERWCATAPAQQDLLRGVADRIRPLVPYDAAAWLVTDPTTTLFTDGVIEGFASEVCTPWFHNEFWVEDVNKFRDLTGSGRAAVLSATVVDPAGSPRWAELMRPAGLDGEVRFTLDDPTGCWGSVELHRVAGAEDFSPEEADLLADLAPVVAAGLRRVMVERAVLADPRTDGPGLIVVLPDGSVSAGTDAGAAWLELLTGTGVDRPRTALHTIVALARDAGRRPVRLRLRADDGRWVTLHASPMVVGEGVAAVIVEPSRPSDLAALVARAYGLSPREQEVVLALARGTSTDGIASGLFISPHTVRDHIKSVMAKIGVSSRAELVATLFHRHTGFFETVDH